MLYAMRLVGLAMDPFQNSPIAILKDRKVEVSSVQEPSGSGVAFAMDTMPEHDNSQHSFSTPDGQNQHIGFGSKQGTERSHGSTQERILPIWIGEVEAQAIATELLGILSPRPMTHDLIKNMILTMGGEIHRVIVTDLVENTFFASIDLRMPNGEIVTMDARPSDALALALRFRAEIFVESRVIEKTCKPEFTDSHISSEEIRQWDDGQWEELVKQWTHPAVTRYEQ